MGKDSVGNRYFRNKNRNEGLHIGRANTERRWVIYAGEREPSTVPPEWHGWLHHITDDLPQSGKAKKIHKWMKPHQANMTGTNKAYFPAGHEKGEGKRKKATGDYTAWDPNS